MKKLLPILAVLVVILVALGYFLRQPKDIRSEFLKEDITEEKRHQGLELLSKMEEAMGGREVWQTYSQATFEQVADWYGKLAVSHWDTTPQSFRMKVVLGSDDGEMTLLNGPNTGAGYKIENGNFFQLDEEGVWVGSEKNPFYDKMIYKNYWFQFPFRIREASVISFGGKAKVKGKEYDVIYATWGEEGTQSREYDQFLLYLDPETHLLEYLNFTVREKIPAGELTARFAAYKEVDGMKLPQEQYVRLGPPQKDGPAMHENIYTSVSFGSDN